jgi:hypothetical protein
MDVGGWGELHAAATQAAESTPIPAPGSISRSWSVFGRNSLDMNRPVATGVKYCRAVARARGSSERLILRRRVSVLCRKASVAAERWFDRTCKFSSTFQCGSEIHRSVSRTHWLVVWPQEDSYEGPDPTCSWRARWPRANLVNLQLVHRWCVRAVAVPGRPNGTSGASVGQAPCREQRVPAAHSHWDPLASLSGWSDGNPPRPDSHPDSSSGGAISYRGPPPSWP